MISEGKEEIFVIATMKSVKNWNYLLDATNVYVTNSKTKVSTTTKNNINMHIACPVTLHQHLPPPPPLFFNVGLFWCRGGGGGTGHQSSEVIPHLCFYLFFFLFFNKKNFLLYLSSCSISCQISKWYHKDLGWKYHGYQRKQEIKKEMLNKKKNSSSTLS